MSISDLTPAFDMHLPLPVSTVDQKIREILSREPWSQNCLAFERFAELHVPKTELRYWTPHLSLTLDDDGANGTRIHARFEPRQEVWTFVWVVYLALGFTAFFAMIYVYAVSLLKQSTWMSAVPILALTGIAALHFASRTGQRWSSDQMQKLRLDCELLMDKIRESNIA